MLRLLLVLLALLASPVLAQTGMLRVAVTHDARPVEGATVRSGTRGALTDARGLARLELPAGPHDVMVARVGLQPATLAVVMRIGLDTIVHLALDEQETALETVVVAATRSERRIDDEPLRVEVLGQEEVEEKLMMTPGDISMMLNETTGLRVQTTSPSLGGANVRVQGLRGRYTQILSDGLPLFGGQTGSLGLLQIPPMDLGQVEIIKGAASALYGASALGGVINLVARRPAHDRELLLNQTTLGGSDAVAYVSDTLSGAFGYSLLAGFHRQSRRDVDDEGWADVPGYRRGVLRPRGFWSDGVGRSLLLTGGFTIEGREGGTMDDATAPDGQPFIESLRTRRVDAGAVGRWLRGRDLFSARASATSLEHDHRFGERRESDTHRTGFAEMAWTRAGDRHVLVAGAALQLDAYRAADVGDVSYTFGTPSLFVQDEITPITWLTLSATARVDAHSEYGTVVSPRLSSLVRLGGEWTLRASAGTGWFAPTPFIEETEVVGLAGVTGFRRLRRERARSASLDLGGIVGLLELNATLFGSEVRDPVAVRAVLDDAALELVNAPEPTRTAGGELLARLRREPFVVTASWTRLRSSELDVESGRRRETPLTPRDALGLVAMMEAHDVGRAGLELYYTGRQRLDANPYRSVSRPYLIVGLLAERRVGAVRVFVNAENLLDVRQTRHDPLVLPERGVGGRWTTDAWAPLDGRVMNAGVRLSR